MSISSRIEAIEQHLKDDYDVLGLAGAKGTELPIGYTQVDYLESSGTQYIDTGIKGNQDTKIILDFEGTDFFYSGNKTIIGSRTGATEKHYGITISAGANPYLYSGYNKVSQEGVRISLNTKYNVFKDKNTTYLDNTQMTNTTYTTFETPTNMYIFAMNEGGAKFYSSIKLFTLKIYNNNELIRDFIPCYRNSDNEVGLYDLVNDTFYTNQGTGAFTYGSVVLNRNIQNLKQSWEERLLYFLANGTDVVWNNWLPKVNGTGESITLNNTIEAKMDFVYKGNTSQTGTPTPDSPVDVQVVSGDNTINICGKNLFNKNTITNNAYLKEDGTLLTGVSNDYITSDFISVKPNTIYYKTQTLSPRTKFYDSNKQALDTSTYRDISIGGNAGSFTTPSNAYYFRFTGNVNTSTGININLTMVNKGNNATTYEPYQSQSYAVNLGNIELCKIGTYQDKIYKDNGKWYLNKQIGKVVLDGSENWSEISTPARFRTSKTYNVYADTQQYCNYYGWSFFGVSNNTLDMRTDGIRVSNSTGMTLAQFQTFISNNEVDVYYVLATPTITEITDTTLISQLEEIKKSYNTQTNISQTNADKPFILDVVALGELD